MRLDVECHCTTLRRTTQHLTHVYDRALADVGLKVTQYSLLRMIDRLDAPNLMKLSQVTGLDRSTLGRNVRVLERMKLVTLASGELDERATVVALSSQGQVTLKDAIEVWRRTQKKVERALGPEVIAQLRDALHKLDGL